MIEILYSPKHNRIFLSTMRFELDIKAICITVYLEGKSRSVKPEDLIHIGWL
jgi:hypothetical protein